MTKPKPKPTAKKKAKESHEQPKDVRTVRIDDINFDDSYQRGEVPKHRRIVLNYDHNSVGIPLIAQREDGSLWGVDGRQRITAKRKLGHKTIQVEVIQSTGPEFEAHQFRNLNGNRTAPTAGEIFKSRLTSGDRAAWAIKDAIEKAGFALALGKHRSPYSDRKWKEVVAISTVCRAYDAIPDKAAAAERITRVLHVLGEAWPEDPKTTATGVLGGMLHFYASRGGNEMVDDGRLIERLRKTQPAKILYTAGLGVGDRNKNFSDTVARLYSARLKRS